MTDYTPTMALPSWATTIITMFLNKGISWAASALVTTGLLTSDQTASFAQIALGIGLGAIGLLWSWVKVRIDRSHLTAAIVAPAAIATTHGGDVVAVPGAQ